MRIVAEGDIEFIRMQFTGIFDQFRNVAITASQIEKAINNQIMIHDNSIEGFTRIHESDQYLWLKNLHVLHAFSHLDTIS